MNKEKFLEELKKSLNRLPTKEIAEIVQDFEEHFRFAKEEGKSEEEVAELLGSPQQIAKELTATYHIENAGNTASTTNLLRAVWAVIGLGFFNLIIVLGPFMALVGMVFAGWSVCLSFILSPLLVLVNGLLYPKTFELFDVFSSFILVGLGISIGIGMFYGTRGLIRLFIRYLQFNIKFIKGGMKHA